MKFNFFHSWLLRETKLSRLLDDHRCSFPSFLLYSSDLTRPSILPCYRFDAQQPSPWLPSTWTNERRIVLARVYPNVCFLRIFTHVERIFVERHHFLRIFFLFHRIANDTERGVKFVAKCGNNFFPLAFNILFSTRFIVANTRIWNDTSACSSENFSLSEFESNIITEYIERTRRTTSRVHCLRLPYTQVLHSGKLNCL